MYYCLYLSVFCLSPSAGMLLYSMNGHDSSQYTSIYSCRSCCNYYMYRWRAPWKPAFAERWPSLNDWNELLVCNVKNAWKCLLARQTEIDSLTWFINVYHSILEGWIWWWLEWRCDRWGNSKEDGRFVWWHQGTHCARRLGKVTRREDQYVLSVCQRKWYSCIILKYCICI